MFESLPGVGTPRSPGSSGVERWVASRGRNTMSHMRRAAVAASVVGTILLAASATARDPAAPGTEVFGLTTRELVQNIEEVEALIARCMRVQGFEYVAVDYETVRRGMEADKMLPGLEEEEFIARYGFGISTLYTGRAIQLTTGYSPAKMGLGRRNLQIYMGLSAADRVAYNRALFGDSTDATFTVGLETESFSRCGGCTREAIGQVFEPKQLEASYYNPKDALINKDPRMKEALRKWSAAIRKEGFDYDHPDQIELDVQARLDAITGAGTIPVEALSPDSLAALEKLQDYERRVSMINFKLEEELIELVEERIERELFARKVN
jgi:hypothetical protein